MSLFTKVAVKVPRRNAFGLSAENHLTANFGQLIPVLVQECFPGDKHRIRTEATIKLAPLVAPVMGRIDVYFHTFFVPHRLLYENWEKFITGGELGDYPNGGDIDPATGTPAYVAPFYDIDKLRAGGYLVSGSLCDYLGLPSFKATDAQIKGVPPISALPMMAYNKIYSDWYRDELLDPDEVFEPLVDGEILPVDRHLALKYRCWHKDYFTSARPDTQLGPPVSVPVSGDISGDGPLMLGRMGASTFAQSALQVGPSEDRGAGESPRYVGPVGLGGSSSGNLMQYVEGLTLDEAGVLINDLRRALRLQEWQEKNMRGGNRYIENIFHHFGVKSSDARLQRSQYLGGKKMPVVVGEIPQSVDTIGSTAYDRGERYLGERGGIANAQGVSKFVTKFCEEHGFIITLMSIMPHASYQQGIPRFFGARWDRFDYLWPEFGNLGEQEVYNWELYVKAGDNSDNDGVFGYQSRYADMKFTPSAIHGEFRDSLRFWHNGRIFSDRPNLNSNFVHFPSDDEAGDQNRIFAVTENSKAAHFYCHLFNHVTTLRMLPKYGIPGI